MIDQALLFLKEELSAYLLMRTNSAHLGVKLSKLVNENGTYAFPEENIALTIFNLEEDSVFRAQVPDYANVDGQHIRREPELKITLHVLFAANFNLYEEAWKAISMVLTFFQAHPVFLSEEYPGLSTKIGKLSLELESLTFEQLNQIWAYMGAKYLPSVAYRIRLVVIQDENTSIIQKPITSIITNINTR